jgi:hypothetical protein
MIRASRQGESWPQTRRAQTARPRRNVLPASNLFSIRGRGQPSRLWAVVQLLLLFALFTVAGSFLLLMQTTGHWRTVEPNKPSPATDQTAVLPAATLQPAAAGPAAAQEGPDWNLPGPPTATRPHVTSPPPGESAANDEAAGNEPPAAAGPPSAADQPCPTPQAADLPAALPYPTTSFPPAALPEGTQGGLPRVRTTDQSPAVARLPGYIEAPFH